MLQIFHNGKKTIVFWLVILFLVLFFVGRLNLFFQYDQNGIFLSRQLMDFFTTLRSIVIQAFPFLILGIGISIFFEVFLKTETILRILPKNPFISNFLLSTLGVFMPVCECGNVPVARTLLNKGLKPSQVITFLLAAPVINPITIVVTYEAFGDINIVIIRVLSALIISNFIGLLFSLKKNQNEFLNTKFYNDICCNHKANTPRIKKAVGILQKEFGIVFPTLLLGAGIASASQIFVPRELILTIGGSIFLSIIAMILFSFTISICSSVDAFVVLPYLSSFNVGAIMSYLVFGPMIDIKILTMLKTVFKTWTLIILTALVTCFSIITGLIVSFVL